MDAPREDLIRSTPMAVAQTDFVISGLLRNDSDDGDGRLMTGYPIVFDQWTEIDSIWEGHFLERLHPGSLNRTLEQRGDRVQVMFNHGFDPQIGDKPLGKPSVQEPRDFGMWGEVPLSRTSYNDDLIELMRDGALWGQSFRFTVMDERWTDEPDPTEHNPTAMPERTIMEVRLAEWGPVTFPAYEATTLGIRSADAFREYQRSRETPLIEYSALVQEDTAPDSPPTAVPVERKLVELTAPRRAAAINDLNRFLKRGNP